jgi:xanthine/uracil permease
VSGPEEQLTSALGQRFEVIAVAVLICVVIFELVRRKHLMERYAILWLLAGATVLVLAIWQGLLTTLSEAAGIYYPPAALFAVAFLFVLILLLHFSVVISRLSDQNKILAQRVAMLQLRLERESAGQEGEAQEASPAPAVNQPDDEPSHPR